MPATTPETLARIAPGARVIVRDLDWQVEEVEVQGMGTSAIVRCIGRSELVRGQPASFFSDIDQIEPEDPTQTKFILDQSPQGIATRLAIDSMTRRTPLAASNTKVMVGNRMLADDLPFQLEPFRKTTEQIQPRILIADAVGLGKTIEVGIILSELQRRGRANRVLVVVPRHILDQVQHELWTRFAFPLVRLDSDGIRRLHQRIPAGRNPFAYYNRAIVSIDTLKQPGRYRHHLERVRWDAVWIDESHKLVNRNTYNNQLAQVLAPNADALILSSATPHNGKPESFAELISLLDPTAVPDPKEVTADDIAHLVVRRHKHSPDVIDSIGDKWAARAEPQVVQVKPSPAEEQIFTELSENWVHSERQRSAGATSVATDRLFPYTLLKAALSSPKALHESIVNRLRGPKRTEELRHADTSTLTPEEAALLRLLQLAEQALGEGSAKLDALVKELQMIGVGPNSPTRAVIFSERIGTLDWIAAAIRERLNLPEAAVTTFHNSKSDEEQRQVVEDFSMASAKVRVLVTSDIASEGVNLHKQCHHLIHADLPWSLITTTQRNGRIDRYGQLNPPEIRYLVYMPNDPEVAGDVRILSKLIAKEHEAHRALGDAASVMGLHSESAEEEAIIRALQRPNEQAKDAALEEAAPSRDTWDPWSFAGLDRLESDAGKSAESIIDGPPTAKIGALRSLFADDADFLTQALRHSFTDFSSLDWQSDGNVISFAPPEDLLRRLEVLPQSYLKQRDIHRRLRLTTDDSIAERSLREARDGKAGDEKGTAWPEIHFLGPLHPVLDWISDRVLYDYNRQEAPALVAGVQVPTILVSGVWSNKMGEPIADAWLAATVEDGMVVFSDMFETLKTAGVRSGMVNPGGDRELHDVSALLPQVISSAMSYLQNTLDDQVAEVEEVLQLTRSRLESWQGKARELVEGMPPSAQQTQRRDQIERVSGQVESLLEEHEPATAPLLRVVAAIVPHQESAR